MVSLVKKMFFFVFVNIFILRPLHSLRVIFLLSSVLPRAEKAPKDFLKYLNEESYKIKTNRLSDILETIAKYDYRLIIGANSEIQLSALLAELGKIGK